ncbi:MAG: hypothetical protein ACP5JG_12585 [Anaerolineae bacterium]
MMVIPDPPKRRDRKAMLYLEELKSRILADRQVPVEDEASATLYAIAMVVVAFFGDEERELLREVYHARTEGECLYEVRTACACDDKDQLCLILDYMMTQPRTVSSMVDYMMDVIETEGWRSVQEEMKERRFAAGNFVWWAFQPIG